jgi:hypothetical protein
VTKFGSILALVPADGPTDNYSQAEFGCTTLSDPLVMCVLERLVSASKETAISTVPVEKLVAGLSKLRTTGALT